MTGLTWPDSSDLSSRTPPAAENQYFGTEDLAAGPAYGPAVDLSEALAQLPRAYALALRLHELGADTGLIAECLDIDPESVGPMLAVAAAKLASVGHIDLRHRADTAGRSPQTEKEDQPNDKAQPRPPIAQLHHPFASR